MSSSLPRRPVASGRRREPDPGSRLHVRSCPSASPSRCRPFARFQQRFLNTQHRNILSREQQQPHRLRSPCPTAEQEQAGRDRPLVTWRLPPLTPPPSSSSSGARFSRSGRGPAGTEGAPGVPSGWVDAWDKGTVTLAGTVSQSGRKEGEERISGKSAAGRTKAPSAQRGENWCGAFSVGAGTGTGRGWPGGASAGGGRAAARTAGGQLPLRPHFPSGSTELGSQSKDRNRHAVVSLRVLQGSRVKGMLASLERFIVQVWLTFLERLAGLESAGWGSQAETREGLLLRFRPNVISLDTQGRASAGGLVP